MEETATIDIVLKELREFRTENNKRWEENDRRWEQNDKRWEQNEKRWEENDKRWEENDRRWAENEKRWIENNKRLGEIEERVTKTENTREADKKEFIRVFEIVEKTVVDKISEMEETFGIKFDKLEAELINNKIEHRKFMKDVRAHENKLNLQELRIDNLESWKDNFDMGTFSAV